MAHAPERSPKRQKVRALGQPVGQQLRRGRGRGELHRVVKRERVKLHLKESDPNRRHITAAGAIRGGC